jgi:hypothetical protein
MTIREGFEKARSYYESVGDAEMVEFFTKRLEQVEKKNSAERKPTQKQVENAGFKADIISYMESGVLYACADIVKGVPSIVAAGLTAQRVAQMLRQLAEEGKVVKTEEKRKTFYSLA